MRNGKGITESWLADQLQPFGIRPRTMRIGQMQADGNEAVQVADSIFASKPQT